MKQIQATSKPSLPTNPENLPCCYRYSYSTTSSMPPQTTATPFPEYVRFSTTSTWTRAVRPSLRIKGSVKMATPLASPRKHFFQNDQRRSLKQSFKGLMNTFYPIQDHQKATQITIFSLTFFDGFVSRSRLASGGGWASSRRTSKPLRLVSCARGTGTAQVVPLPPTNHHARLVPKNGVVVRRSILGLPSVEGQTKSESEIRNPTRAQW